MENPVEVLPNEGDEKLIQITLPVGFRKKRADKAISELYTELSRSRIQKLFDSGNVWLEDEVLSKSDKVRAGDAITVSIPPPTPLKLKPVDLNLEILYEDEDIIVINKRPGMVVHPGAGTGEDTLVHALLFHCQGQLSGIGGAERPGIVHRLDKETSGVILAAKSDQGFKGLSRQFAERKTHKVYRALVQGGDLEPEGTLTGSIGRHQTHRTKMTIREDGRSAKSEFKCIQKLGRQACEAEVTIHTGRTHQVRVHMASIGFPLLGDQLYGFKPKAFPVEVPRIMLHAWKHEFEHPVSAKVMSIEAPLPQDYQQMSADSVLIDSD